MLPASQRGLPVHASASEFVFETGAKPTAERTLWRPACAARAAAPAARMAPPCPAAATRSAAAPPRAPRPRSGSTAHIRATCWRHVGQRCRTQSGALPGAVQQWEPGAALDTLHLHMEMLSRCGSRAHGGAGGRTQNQEPAAKVKVRKGVLTRGSSVPTPPSCRWSGETVIVRTRGAVTAKRSSASNAINLCLKMCDSTDLEVQLVLMRRQCPSRPTTLCCRPHAACMCRFKRL